MRVCLVTIPAGEGVPFARMLLSQAQCACVNVLPTVQSLFLDDGEIRAVAEELLIIKVDSRDLGTLHTAVVENHPYDTPEFVVLPVDMDSTDNDYARWVHAATRF